MIRIIIAVAVFLSSSIAFSEAITVPNTFTAGTNAVASEVNGNFQAVEAGVDDNAGDIDALESAIVAPSTPGLNQGASEVDLRYDTTANCYYLDADGDASRDTAPTTGEREGCLGLGDEIWPEEFASGSSTLGIQEAIDVICTSGKPERGAVLRLRGGVYDLGTAQLSVPVNCNGFTMSGVSPDTYNGVIGAGTEIKTTHTGAGFDFMTLAGTLRDVELSNFRVTVTDPGASTRIFVVGSLTSKFNLHDVMISKGGAADADGIGLHITDPVKCRIELNEFELLGAGIVHTGTLGAGGCTYRANRIETQGNTTGVGLLIGEGNYACTNVFVEGNIFEGNNIGMKIDTTASGAKSCKIMAIGNHFENATIGSNYEDVRATGANSYVSIGNYYAGGGSGAEDVFHRTTDTDTASTDMFIGDQLYGTITMDAGACAIFGAADWYSGGNITACARMSVDSSGYYIDVNGDGDFDSGTDMRMADADLIDLADGTITGDFVNTANPWADNEVSDTLTLGASSTATTASAEDNDTSVATTAYVQGEFGDLGAYTVGTSAPTDGSTACTNGDMYLDESANKIYFCVDSATDDWFGVALSDTP